MATYSITYETADGSVDTFTTETSKARAERVARNLAKTSGLNAPLEITRWFVEAKDATVSTFPVAA